MTDPEIPECCPPVAMPPEEVAKQTAGYFDLLQGSNLGADTAGQWMEILQSNPEIAALFEQGSDVTLDAINTAIMLQTAPILETIQNMDTFLRAMAEGLVVFRAEVLSLLNNKTEVVDPSD